MLIERTMLLEHFQRFVSGGSGMVVGAPGVGKTYLLQKYTRACLDSGDPCLYLPIDKVGARSESELMAELGIDTSFTRYLKSQEMESCQAVLVVDAFDAARSEYAQHFVIGLVRRAVEELGDKWRVIVSVRSYDAKHSITLQSLFPSTIPSNISEHYKDISIKCRHFSIPILSEAETQAAVASVPGLAELYETAGVDFRELMRVPFNIWLGESLLSSGALLPDLTTVASESQLLGLYWRHRVNDTPHASELSAVLSRITAEMVKEHSLSAQISEVYPVGARSTWELLLSAEVLEEVLPKRQRVSYSHNILFDYAVSALLIDPDPVAACKFLAEDLSRPLFLRPSVDYFFTELWDSDPSGFWNVVWHMLNAPETHVRVYARLVPLVVATREARSVDQFQQLLERTAKEDATAANCVLHLFQAIRGLFKHQRKEIWAGITSQISSHIQPKFAWELGALTFDILDIDIGDKSDDVEELCARTGRQILAWALRVRTELEGTFVDKVGSMWGIPIVCRTFGREPEKSRELLLSVLDQIGDSDFPIEYLSRLTNDIRHIWDHDSDLAVKVYSRTFGHEELSESRTDFGTPVLPMSSTRRQDFTMCQYHLSTGYPTFLKAAPGAAATAAVRALNGHILRNYVVRYLNPGYNVSDLTETFTFRGQPATYIRDLSYSWESSGGTDDATSLGDQLFGWLKEELRNNGEEKVNLVIDVLAAEATVAYWWKQLLELGSDFPEVLAQVLFPLVVARPVLQNLETLQAVGLFIERAAGHLTLSQREELERLVLANVDTDNAGNTVTVKRDRLIACFPRELISTVDGRRLRDKLETRGSLPKNDPLVDMSVSWGPYNDKEWLEEQGADLELLDNIRLLEVTDISEEFGSMWRNSRPSEEAIADFIPALMGGLDAVRAPGMADIAVVRTARTRLSLGAAAVAKNLDKDDTEVFGLVKTVLLTGVRHDPPPARNPEADASYTFASWSSSPATAAAQGLPWLARLTADEDVLRMFEALAADPRPEVRYLAAQGSLRLVQVAPEVFWRIIETGAISEKSPAVQDALCRTLGYVFFEDVGRATAVLGILTQHLLVPDSKSDALKTLTSIALSLTLSDPSHDWGVSVTNKLLEESANYSHAFAHAVFEAANRLDPRDVDSVHDELLTRRIDWLSKAIASTMTGLQAAVEDATEAPVDSSSDLLKRLYGVLDEIVIRIYFSLRRKRTETDRDDVTEEQRAQYYMRIRPLLEQIIELVNTPTTRLSFPAPTAHRFMEVLGEVLDYDPRGVLSLAEAVAVASERGGYHLDSMAADETVTLAERIFTDYRSELRHEDALSSLVTLLDLFAKVGWPRALRLLWSLDEIFR